MKRKEKKLKMEILKAKNYIRLMEIRKKVKGKQKEREIRQNLIMLVFKSLRCVLDYTGKAAD